MSPNTNGDGRRHELARIFKLGLLRFIAGTPLASRLKIVCHAPFESEAKSPKSMKDPWDFWVYRIGANGNLDDRSQSKSSRISGNLSARRITNDWKISFSSDGSCRQTKYTFDDGTSSVYSLRSYSANARVV